MPRLVTRRHFSRFERLIASFLICWFASLASDAYADIQINSKSNLVLLSDYSIDLEKQELTPPVRASVIELFGALQADLQDMLGPNANVEYMPERSLAYHLDSQGLPKGSREAIQKLFESKKYTHLIAADVQVVGPETSLVDLLVAKLFPDGSIGEKQVIRTIKMTTTTNLADIRNQVFRDFGKLQDVNAPRTVFIKCIKPRSPSVGGNIAPIARLERLLGREVTNALINFYHSAKMQERYRAVVDSDTYRWDDKDMSCSLTTSRVTSAKPDQFDYSLGGVVAISHPTTDDNFGYDNLDLAIEVLHTHPDCRRMLHIEENRLNPSQDYSQPEEFATSFSDHLPDKFGPEWTDKVENKSCS
jgi:hypothetical protein